MRLVLVDNLLLEDGRVDNLYLQPHLGLISLVAVAWGAGHDAVLYDPKVDLARGALRLEASLYREIADRLLAEDPDAVGLTTLGCNFICAVKVARHLKSKRPRLPILLGGPHATILDTRILAEFPEFDVVVRNEAELTLPPVLERISGGDLSGIPGVTYRSGSGITANPAGPLVLDLDKLPWPAFDSYPLESLGLSFVQILSPHAPSTFDEGVNLNATASRIFLSDFPHGRGDLTANGIGAPISSLLRAENEVGEGDDTHKDAIRADDRHVADPPGSHRAQYLQNVRVRAARGDRLVHHFMNEDVPQRPVVGRSEKADVSIGDHADWAPGRVHDGQEAAVGAVHRQRRGGQRGALEA